MVLGDGGASVTKIQVVRSGWKVWNKNSPTGYARELSVPPKEGLVLKDDVFYGRAILQLPRENGLMGNRLFSTTSDS